MPPKKITETYDLQNFAEQFFKKCKDLSVKKNNDYAGAVENDPFSNFKLVETMGAATVEQGFMTRISDKVARLATFTSNKQLQVKTESVQDTLKDLANYAMLFAAYLDSKAE